MNVIVCHDGYEARIRELRAAIEVLDGENNGNDDPFRFAKSVLTKALWDEFDDMCGDGNKHVYTEDEWRTLWKGKEARKKADLTPMRKWDTYLDHD